ncbi:MAG: type IV pilus assembly protein PilM [SAR92 clade bacterium]|mgnify:FL=1|nr:type IV pilus assembly protein PilM [SAR92 clade bacterium]
MDRKKIIAKITALLNALLFRTPSRTALLGIDISSSAVKLVELHVNQKGHFEVVSYAVVPLPEGAVRDHEIADEHAVANAINAVLEKSGSTCSDVSVAMAGSFVLNTIISVPVVLSPLEVESRVQADIEAMLPYALEQASVDFIILGENPALPDELLVQVVACPKEQVELRQSVLQSAGLDLRIVDVESFALGRAYGLLIGEAADDNQAHAVIDIGASQITFAVISGKSIIYSTETAFGGKQLTEEIQQHYNLSWSDAGRAKRKGGLSDDYGQVMLEPFKHSLIKHIDKAMKIFYSSSESIVISKLVLSGGVSKLDGLADDIASALSIPAEVGDVLKHLTVNNAIDANSFADEGPAMMLALGLALSESR